MTQPADNQDLFDEAAEHMTWLIDNLHILKDVCDGTLNDDKYPDEVVMLSGKVLQTIADYVPLDGAYSELVTAQVDGACCHENTLDVLFGIITKIDKESISESPSCNSHCTVFDTICESLQHRFVDSETAAEKLIESVNQFLTDGTDHYLLRSEAEELIKKP